jgi:hypothetical protein
MARTPVEKADRFWFYEDFPVFLLSGKALSDQTQELLEGLLPIGDKFVSDDFSTYGPYSWDTFSAYKMTVAFERYRVWMRTLKHSDASRDTMFSVLAFWIMRCRPFVKTDTVNHQCNLQIALGLVTESVAFRKGNWIMTPKIQEEVTELLTFSNINEDIFRLYVSKL